MNSLLRTASASLVTGCFALLANSRAAGAAEAAAPLDLGLSLGGGWSDNIAYRSDNEKSGVFAELGLVLGYLKESARLHSDVDINLGYSYFSTDGGVSHLTGGGSAAFTATIVPDAFQWQFLDNYSQFRTDALMADTPDNLSGANFFSTGPDVFLALGPQTRVGIHGLYSVESFGAVDETNDRADGSIGLEHATSGGSVASLNIDVGRHWLADETANFTTRNAFLEYQINGTRTDLGSAVGYGEVQTALEKSGGLLMRLYLQRQVSPSSMVRLNLSRQYTTRGDALRSEQSLDGVDPEFDLGLVNATAFLQRTVSMEWSYTRSRTSFNLGAGYSKEGYLDTPGLDRELATYDLVVRRQIRPTAALEMGVRGSVEEFDIAGARVDEVRSYLSLQINQARTLGWTVTYEFRKRGGNGPIAKFTENRVSLFVVWNPLGRQ